MKCEKCGNEYEGNFCPNCGKASKGKYPLFKKWWFWLPVVVLVVCILLAVNDISNGEKGGGANAPQTSESAPVGESESETAIGTEPEPVTEPETVTEPEITETVSKYQQIYDEYSNKIRDVGISELAEISNEGIGKMAKYMLNAKGKDGQYETYQEWAEKLMDVYMSEAR